MDRSCALGLASMLLLACAEPTPRGTSGDAGRTTDAAVRPRDASELGDASEPDDAGAPDVGSMPDAGPPPPACPRIRVVTPGEVLNVRPTPSTAMAVIGTLPDGAIVEVVDTVHGESIGGVDLWFQIASPSVSGFVFS